MKKTVIDSSSAILLFKTGLASLLASSYALSVPESVYGEITQRGYPGADFFQNKHHEGKISITTCDQASLSDLALSGAKLDKGEAEVISCYLSGHFDFIMTDDGQAAQFCRRHNMPFINALLFPRILCLSGMLTKKQCQKKIKDILAIGRYGKQVIDFAENCGDSELDFFRISYGDTSTATR